MYYDGIKESIEMRKSGVADFIRYSKKDLVDKNHKINDIYPQYQPYNEDRYYHVAEKRKHSENIQGYDNPSNQLLALHEVEKRLLRAREENVKLKQYAIQRHLQKQSDQTQYKQRQKSLQNNIDKVNSHLQSDSRLDNESNKIVETSNNEYDLNGLSAPQSASGNGKRNGQSSDTPINLEKKVESNNPENEQSETTIPKQRKGKLKKVENDESKDITDQLKDFANEVTNAVDVAKKNNVSDDALNENTTKDNERREKEKMLLEEMNRRKEARSNIASLLEEKEFFMIPLWRHKLNGNFNPPPEQILKGKQLFRLIWYVNKKGKIFQVMCIRYIL